ncbi:putative g-protein coupled receptor [Diaporthe ampelina]|uniref:Putative g-protein coupled receptor n=1 Tax=Diaporthe ampelina TaxID=1214573 RepID=A0A0G2FIL8_9PEZI|nr:putative g-protein coupled receptor [Diaporthe ampelina]
MDEPLAEDREFAMLDEAQIDTLNAVERMGATLSLFGIILIFITFALFRRLRTIPNTFIFFASIANVGACVACLIAFMQSDPWWSFAMAINVYMVFFMSFNPTTFRQYLWLYCVICFGLPAIPSFVFLFLRESRGLVYGDAAAKDVEVDVEVTCDSSDNLASHAGDVLSASVTLVNSNDSGTFGFPKASARDQARNFENISFNGTQFTSTISAGSASKDDYDRDPSPTRALPPLSANVSPCSGARRRQPPAAPAVKVRRRLNMFQRLARGARRFGAKLRNMDPVKLAYLRTSFVFAISVLVTWTPSSINRVYTLVYPDQASYGLNIAAAVVLPLQGVWNAVIYFTTSWKIFREEMEATRAGLRVLEFLRLDGGGDAEMTGHGSSGAGGGSFAIGSSVLTPRSEMGRSRRLDGESRDGNNMELVAAATPQRPRPAQRTSTMRVTSRGLDDFS